MECQQPLAVLDNVGGVLTPQDAKEDVVDVRAAAERGRGSGNTPLAPLARRRSIGGARFG